MGVGSAGFATSLERISNLPRGSGVGVAACLRTKGDFLCPRVYEGLRHFERTGCEPYVGMLPLLFDVARRRDLKILWLPDEGRPCGDCELNR